jgi:glycosidase
MLKILFLVLRGWSSHQRARSIRAAWAALALAFALLTGVSPARASNLKVSAGSATPLATGVEADYTTSHLFVDEVAGDRAPITVFFDPQTLNVETAELYTNLNRRDRAAKDADGDGVEDGIKPPPGDGVTAGDDRHYYQALPMRNVAGGYQLTIMATRCGAYRLTARYRLNGDAPGTHRWYGSETNPQGILKRDHCLVISPRTARDVQLYEVNPLTIIATGTLPDQRGTFADLAAGLPAGKGPLFSLAYAKQLGVNMLWMLPIHADGIDGRQTNPETGKLYTIGSPYAVKNFFTVMPLLARGFTPGSTPLANDTAAGRDQAMADFQRFVKAADAQGVGVMLDAPFNHSAHDVELAAAGQKNWGSANTSETSEIRNVEARFFSRRGAYDLRAAGADSVAVAPDRFDFDKFNDVFDVYFGRYAALVPNTDPAQKDDYRNEGDWFDYSVGQENGEGAGNGHFDAVTQKVWRYFGDYVQFWLTQTGYPANESGASLDTTTGIDSLRADFGQGLPPPCWEFIINRARSRKWNLVFMAESLDGGPVTYRSARHFDVLNENILFGLHHARSTNDYRALFDDRRASYGAGLVLLNTSSHDEDNYKDPFEALLRFAVNSTVDGIPLISAGQEIGLRGTIVPPNDSDPAAGPPFGYDLYEKNFGKQIPQFKEFNSLMPLWREAARQDSDAAHLHNLYAAIGMARRSSPALRGANRVFLNLKDNTLHGQIFSIAKFERRNVGPKDQDVVLAFVNLVRGADVATPPGNAFDVNVDADHDGVNDFGIRPDHLYNVKNLAAYTAADPHRRDTFLWGAGRKGSDLLASGTPVQLHRVPSDKNGWASAPYEAQYLKLIDVTP